MKKYFLLLIAFICFKTASFADSPLTSTNFAEAYANEKIIKTASLANGYLTTDLLNYLAGNNPVDVKMAVINALGWDNGNENSVTYLDFLQTKKAYKGISDFQKRGTAEELISYAYLKALENRYDLVESLQCVDLALKKSPKSFTLNIIAAIIKSQNIEESNWCVIFKNTDEVRRNISFTKDMKEEAMKIIFEYMDSYKEYCK